LKIGEDMTKLESFKVRTFLRHSVVIYSMAEICQSKNNHTVLIEQQ